MIHTQLLDLDTSGNFSVVNITEQVRKFVQSTGVTHGQVLVFYKHTTGAVLIGEHEAGFIADLQAFFERVTPINHNYLHHLREVDFNGHAHIRSALLTVTVNIPVLNGNLMLGTYQDILVIDDQTDPAQRTVILQVIGE